MGISVTETKDANGTPTIKLKTSLIDPQVQHAKSEMTLFELFEILHKEMLDFKERSKGSNGCSSRIPIRLGLYDSMSAAFPGALEKQGRRYHLCLTSTTTSRGEVFGAFAARGKVGRQEVNSSGDTLSVEFTIHPRTKVPILKAWSVGGMVQTPSTEFKHSHPYRAY
ncbi:hypothetical protein JNK13_07240 [bacterium]|nr:hypothetical protein [bacterium]